MKNKRIAIVGAGFSGLTLAWQLTRLGLNVDIFDKENRVGGLLKTDTSLFLSEEAANAFLASLEFENLISDLDLKIIKSGHVSKKRWIFNKKPRLLPISFFTLVFGLLNFLKCVFFKEHRPQNQETLKQWGDRVLNAELSDYVLSPAFQGVYGVTAEQLSSKLVLAGLFSKNKIAKGQHKCSLCFQYGMSELTEALKNKLSQSGACFINKDIQKLTDISADYSAVAIATHILQMKKIVNSASTSFVEAMSNIECVDLTSINVSFDSGQKLKGFGCLFPKNEKFNSLGVLFNNHIFSGRDLNQNGKSIENQTWIFDKANLNESDYISQILQDRSKLLNINSQPLSYKINNWPQVLPLYNINLEAWLNKREQADSIRNGFRIVEIESPVYLTGNYLGGIGLTKILDYNFRLANRIKNEMKSRA